jgi:hypothetical protein
MLSGLLHLPDLKIRPSSVLTSALASPDGMAYDNNDPDDEDDVSDISGKAAPTASSPLLPIFAAHLGYSLV